MIIIILIIFLIIILSKKDYFDRVSKKSKEKTLNTISNIILIVGLIYGLVYIGNINNHKELMEESPTPADGFTIDRFLIDMDVKEDNKINVHETIYINFYEGGHHGIYRFIPEWLSYTNKNNETMSRKAKISNLSALGKYTVDVVNNKKRIKIGDPNETLTIGTYKYEINYTYDMGGDPYEGFDEFIFHAFGDYWGTPIKNAQIEIRFPKDITDNTIHFFADKKRKMDITNSLDYSIDGNILKATFLNNNGLNRSLTIDLELPDNYFVGGNNYGNTSLILCIICIVIMIISLLLWFSNGKDFDKEPETIEFYPPDGLDAAVIGYINKGEVGKKLTVALIIELAAKGYIKITEDNDGKNITISKNEGTDTSKLTNNQKIVYDGLFENDKTSTILDANMTFYKTFEKINTNVMLDCDMMIKDNDSYYGKLFVSIGFMISVILLGIAYTTVEDLNPKLSFLYAIALTSIIITFILGILMKRKTSYGELISAKINGFKNFIEVARKEEIDKLIEENPSYFYSIIPYAYVLGVSKKWISKFENIPLPPVEMGNYDFTDIDSFDSFTNHVYRASSYHGGSGNSSSGCSSCGGGCSSCGGGCSSCGGGGSW